MTKILDITKNVADLCKQYPELKVIMADLGFKDITKPLILNTMGKMTTIPRGAVMKNIPMDKILTTFAEKGFTVINVPGEQEQIDVQKAVSDTDNTARESDCDLNDNEILLKSYIKRLTEGEDIEVIREEFVKNFSDVSAIEIARAEQSLMKDGTSLSDVQKLCDVHSALFHGATSAERIANAEKEVERSAKEEQDQKKEQEHTEQVKQMTSGFGKEAALKTKELMNIIGHPLHVLTLENHEIIKLVEEIEIILKEQQNICSVLNQLEKLTTIAQHYGKKDELMFPLLKDKYTYPGPSDVMWGVEDEIRADLRKIITDVNEKSQNIAQNNSQETAKDNSFVDELQNLIRVLSRIREMIYKEENILFPLCAGCFTDEEWIAIAKDFPMFGACMIQDIPLWDKVKEAEAMAKSMINSEIGAEEGTVKLPGGSFNLTQLRAMLNTLPMEITLIDENDTNLFFNEGEKLFTRPMMALGRPVYSCHPKRVEPMVRMLIHDFKTGKKDSMHIMSEKCGRQVLINYYALRDDNGTYLGTLEAVQEMDGIADAIKKGKKGPIKL